ncbi:MAG: hypothetical protein VX684_09035, partial [Planctomycetota bacterium]|nr:hypothetical protein [Planctomycetota bacterium]
MHIEPFVMERWQSTYEHQVELNLSDSGVHPLTVQELLEPGESESRGVHRQRKNPDKRPPAHRAPHPHHV